ncbi:MAG: class I SAM-dependent methyltransferase [Pseudomonadota bacterium]
MPNPDSAENEIKLMDTARKRLKYAHFPFIGRVLAAEMGRTERVLRVLDVGCGPGNLPLLSDTGLEFGWFGLDLWRHQLTQAADKDLYRGLCQVNLVHGLPLRTGAFDALICNEVLMYLPNHQQLLAEFNRVLRTGGLALVYNPISWAPEITAVLRRSLRTFHQERNSVSFDRQTDWKPAERACRITYYSLDSLVTAVENAGFAVEQTVGFRLFRNRVRLMNRLENIEQYRAVIGSIAGRYPRMASDVLVVARKSKDG